jgi:hypothetical protein
LLKICSRRRGRTISTQHADLFRGGCRSAPPSLWSERYGTRNPFSFMELQDGLEVTNFFERKVSAYQIAVSGAVALHEDF